MAVSPRLVLLQMQLQTAHNHMYLKEQITVTGLGEPPSIGITIYLLELVHPERNCHFCVQIIFEICVSNDVKSTCCHKHGPQHSYAVTFFGIQQIHRVAL